MTDDRTKNERASSSPGSETSKGGQVVPGSRRGMLALIAGLLAAGVAAGYNWWRKLPK